MKKKNLLSTLAISVALLFANTLYAKTDSYELYPSDKAVDICVDTHLNITFKKTPTLGNKGTIRVYDAKTGELVDNLDIAIPSGPTEPRTYGPECDYTKVPYDYSRTAMPTNKTTRPGTPSGGAEPNPPCYQLNIIGGFTDAFHFHPVIINGNTATIYLRNNMLEYGHTYKVNIDKSVFKGVGFNGIKSWSFTTKGNGPKGNTIRVNADGKGDFATVQGALDYVPDFSSEAYYINVSEGDYEEIVYARNKKNLHIAGAGMDKTKVHYANCEVFNPHPLTLKTNERPGTFPSRRAAFMLDNCTDVTLKDMTIATDMQGQAEGLLINGERMALYRVHIIGSGDAMQGNGTIYMERCEMDGGGDTFLGRGSIFLYRCNLRNDGGPFTWIRNTEGHHGDVFVECTLSTFNGRKVDFGRCPDNHGKTYPYAEQVMIRCKTSETIPEGWSAIGVKSMNFCEFDTRDITTGKPVDVSSRNPLSRQLDAVKDAEMICNYSTPSFVLSGWTPDSCEAMLDLQVSDNHRFLKYSDGRPFFWLGDTGWLLPEKLNREETKQYLATASQNGFNVVQVQTICGVPCHNFYEKRSNISTTNPWDFSDIDKEGNDGYWQHMDYIIEEAQRHGIYIGMTCIWGGLVKAGKIDVEGAKAYGTFLANRYKNNPNVIWIIGGDQPGDVKPEVWNALATTIKSIDNRHLMTYHPRGRTTSAHWWAKAPWIDFHIYQSGHRCYGQRLNNKTYEIPDSTEEDCWMYVDSTRHYFDEAMYQQKYVKPVIDGEPSYEDIPIGLHFPTGPRWMATDVRRYAYWDVFAGTFGHTYGHNAIMQMHRPGEKVAYAETCKPWYEAQCDSGYTEMKYLKALMLSLPYFNRIADQSVVKNNGTRYNRLAATRGDGYLLVYNYTLRPIDIDLTKFSNENTNLWWMDATDGSLTYIGEATKSVSFNPRDISAKHDGVLIVIDKNKSYIKKDQKNIIVQ